MVALYNILIIFASGSFILLFSERRAVLSVGSFLDEYGVNLQYNQYYGLIKFILK